MKRSPPAEEKLPRLKMISFRVDEETEAALKKLVTAEGKGSMRARSTILRRLVLAEASKL